MIYFLWAQTNDGVIGNKGQLPWSIPKEMKHFRKTSLNHAVLMGSKTFDSMNRRPLKNRMNYVITSDVNKYKDVEKTDNLFITSDLKGVINKFKNPSEKLYVIGGASIFEEMKDIVDVLICSIIKKDYIGDVYMPKINYNYFRLTKTEDYPEFVVKYYDRIGNEANE